MGVVSLDTTDRSVVSSYCPFTGTHEQKPKHPIRNSVGGISSIERTADDNGNIFYT